MIITVSGARGILGEDLTVSTAAALAASFAQSGGSPGGEKRFLIARDTRPSGRALKPAAAAGILATGADVVDLDVVTTPGACLMVRQLNAAGAVILTASHNPPQYNGLKFIGPDGMGISAQQAATLKDTFLGGRHAEFRQPTAVGQFTTDDSTHRRHINAVLDVCDKALLRKLRDRQFKVVLDSVNGAGCIVTPQLLQLMGCRVVALNGEPTGVFAHAPEPTADNLTGLCEAVRQQQADVGFAQDPDADRLAIVDETGTYIGEEYSLVLAAMFLMSRRAGSVAVNLSTSRMIDDLAAQHGRRVIRTPVGEANVAAAMLAENCILAGEGNGGVILPDVAPVRDSLVGMALVLQLMIDRDQGVSKLIDELPRYTMIKTKCPIGDKQVDQILSSLAAAYNDAQQNDRDGLRLDWPEQRAWLHVRPSNTEPIIRLIAEAPDKPTAEKLIDQAQQIVNA